MPIPFNPLAEECQRRLKAIGHDLGSSGPRRDGVDGQAGDQTFAAMLKELPIPDRPAPSPRLDRADHELSFAQRQIDLDFLQIAFPANTAAGLEPWVRPTLDACVKWGIDEFREVASFLANINVETNGLTRLEESLNYSTSRLLSIFGRHRITTQQAQRYGRRAGQRANQEMLANILYGGSWGARNLGNTEDGDGWRFRGYGPKQFTGRANHTEYANAIGVDVREVPDIIRTPKGGMDSAGYYWKSRNMDELAATPGLADDRRRINGGLNGLAVVEDIFVDLIDELLRREADGGY